MPLEQYKKKRDFARTPEPAGAHAPPVAPKLGGRFVVQRHRATRLHYDFRLEIDGVLVSWAVPKGPSLDPAHKRMAMHVEDHPIEYLDFEGVIPSRQYGAGDVIVWDWGTWEPEETTDPAASIAAGELKFRLNGQKLKGRFTIVRTRSIDGGSGEPWLLIHKKDEAAVAGFDVEDYPQSVKTGRTNDEVKENRDAVWISSAPAGQAEVDLSAAVEAPLPSFIEPMNATLATHPFDSPDWLFEIKWDGYRVEAIVRDGTVRMLTRRGNDAAHYFPGLLSPPTWINAETSIVDGEVVALDDDGVPHFELLQRRISGDKEVASAPLVYMAFDLLYLDGRLLLKVPLEDRKRLLRSVLRDQPRVQYASHIEAEGRAFFEAARKRELEGILAKRRSSPYEPGRRVTTWLKIKVRPEQELVVGGYIPGEGSHRDLGALLVGTYEGGKLRYGGRVGSGLDTKTRALLKARLDALARPTPPFDPPPPRTGDLRQARFAEPEIVIRAEFADWTREGTIRQSAFKGILEGRDPRTVTRERPIEPTVAVVGASADGESSDGESPDGESSDSESPGGASSPSPRGKRSAAKSRSSAKDRKGSRSAAESRSNTNNSQTKDSGESHPTAKRRSDSDDPGGRRSAAKGGSDANDPRGSRSATENRSNANNSQTKDSGDRKPARASMSANAPKSAGGKAARVPKAAPGKPQRATEEELEALRRLGNEGIWRVGGRELKLTNLDKILFPPRPDTNEQPITKRELIAYFGQIGPVLLPHLAERPLNLNRFPNGVGGPSFWQKDIPKHAPDWLRRWTESEAWLDGEHRGHAVGPDHRQPNTHLVADEVATLCWLGNQAAFEIHAWTSRIEAPDRPTYALVDIDPGERTTWEETLTLARLFRTALGHLHVRGAPKLTGKRGIQIWIPIVPKYSFHETSDWVEGVSRAVGSMVPDLVSWEWSVSDRKGRARLDYTQNQPIKTLVAPYAVRPLPGATVSTPITWDELDDPTLRPNSWTIRTILPRVEQLGDLFADVLTNPQELPPLG
jgi:bifunctional non-homologous end joining protein LigD